MSLLGRVGSHDRAATFDRYYELAGNEFRRNGSIAVYRESARRLRTSQAAFPVVEFPCRWVGRKGYLVAVQHRICAGTVELDHLPAPVPRSADCSSAEHVQYKLALSKDSVNRFVRVHGSRLLERRARQITHPVVELPVWSRLSLLRDLCTDIKATWGSARWDQYDAALSRSLHSEQALFDTMGLHGHSARDGERLRDGASR